MRPALQLALANAERDDDCEADVLVITMHRAWIIERKRLPTPTRAPGAGTGRDARA